MNKVILTGILAGDPDIRIGAGENATAIARYRLAVRRSYSRSGEPDADFINCIAFGKMAEFAEKYFHKGTSIAISGRINTGSYTNRDGVKVYTTDIMVESQEFNGKKADNVGSEPRQEPAKEYERNDGFMAVPDDLEDDGLPFM